MFGKAFAILSGNFAASLVLLARNLVLARFLPVSDYGIAATFAIAMAAVEMVTDFGLKLLIVQSKSGDDPAFQNGLQGLQIARGALAAALLFTLAAPLGYFLRIDEAIDGYRLLALVPLLNGFVHLDIFRFNRSMRFGASILCQFVPAVASLAAIFAFLTIAETWHVLLWAILLQSALTVLLSQLLAERKFRPTFAKSVLKGAAGFGWPVFLNGILMLVMFQADRIAVGRMMGVVELANFSMLMMLTLTPAIIIDRTMQSFFLPQLSAATESFDQIAKNYLRIVVFAALLLVGSIALIGPLLITLVVGAKYDQVIPLLAIGATAQAVRLMKTGPAIVALSQGDTRNSMYGNALRVVLMPGGWFLIQQGYGVEMLMIYTAAVEAVAFALVCILLDRGAKLIEWRTIAIAIAFGSAGFALGATCWIIAMAVAVSGIALSIRSLRDTKPV